MRTIASPSTCAGYPVIPIETAAPPNTDLKPGDVVWWWDDTLDRMKVTVKKPNGTVVTLTVGSPI